jgi:membrane complex biogenesis BtpA family protein
MSERFRRSFPGSLPVIAMAHVPALPGSPLYDAEAGIQGAIDDVRRDLEILLDEGVDGVLFCNENDRPYLLEAPPVHVAALARIVGELAPDECPFGVDYLWDARAALGIAAACGAAFTREVLPGVYESDMGLWEPDAGALLRERRAYGADDLCVLMNVTPEFASALGSRPVGLRARSAVVSSLADAILVSGAMAGAEPAVDTVREVAEAVAGAAPVLLNTGAKAGNIAAFAPFIGGVIVGSDLKRDGDTWSPVERERVRRFLDAARSI